MDKNRLGILVNLSQLGLTPKVDQKGVHKRELTKGQIVVLKFDEQDMSEVEAMWYSPNGNDLLEVVVMCHSMSGEDSLI